MPSYLAYVDQQIAYQLATSLIGSEVAIAKQHGVTTGINFKVMFSASTTQVDARTTKTENLLPEVLLDALYEATPAKTDTLERIWPRLLSGSPSALRPGTPILLTEVTLSSLPQPATAPSTLAGEECDTFLVRGKDRHLQGYCAAGHAQALSGLFGEPAEILGILRYTAPYKVPGAAAINLGLRIVGLWLR